MADVVSVLTGGSNSKTTTAEELNALATDIFSDGVVGAIGNTAGVAPMTGALAVNAQGTPDMTVAVTAGKVYVTCTPTSQGSQRLRASIATQNATIAANSTGGTRYDWIYVAMSASGAANPAVDGTGVATITVSRSTSSATDNGTPPTYGYHIATVTVSNGAATITNGNITDSRSVVALSATNSNTGWITAEATPNTVTALGNRSYSLVFNSLDMTDTVSPGMRLKLTRTVSAPTQCTSLNGTTQYYSKSSPNKLTFTNNFVCSAWVKLTSTTAQSTVVSRFNGTSGWEMRLASGTGQVGIVGWNAGAANFAYLKSYASIPLNRWVHVAAQLDMTTTTVGGTNNYILIDGIEMAGVVTRSGTNPTALVQAGDFQVGASNSLLPFSGKIAQVAVYSAKVAQATILASMHQTLTGSETSLASAYSFNNSKTDLNTTTPNDLTANGSAVETNADSPFAQDAQGVPTGTTEYAVITKTAFSTNTTLTVQVPEGSAIPTSGGVSAMSYSTQSVPLNFVRNRSRWVIWHWYRTNLHEVNLPAINTWYNMSIKISVPTGSWLAECSGATEANKIAASTGPVHFQWSTSASASTLPETDIGSYHSSNVATISQIVSMRTNADLSPSAITIYYMIFKSDVASENNIGWRADVSPVLLKLTPDFL